jgi:hypothetical protein
VVGGEVVVLGRATTDEGATEEEVTEVAATDPGSATGLGSRLPQAPAAKPIDTISVQAAALAAIPTTMP